MLNQNERDLLNHMANVYMAVAKQDLPPDNVNQLTQVIAGIFKKIDGAMQGTVTVRPEGITEEWFEGVCKGCEALNGTQCSNTITAKFPGKCDPILKFERQKILDKKKLEKEAVITPATIIENGKPTNVIDGSDKFKKVDNEKNTKK